MGPYLFETTPGGPSRPGVVFELRRKDSNLQSPDPESGGLPISRLLNESSAEIKLRIAASQVYQPGRSQEFARTRPNCETTTPPAQLPCFALIRVIA